MNDEVEWFGGNNDQHKFRPHITLHSWLGALKHMRSEILTSIKNWSADDMFHRA